MSLRVETLDGNPLLERWREVTGGHSMSSWERDLKSAPYDYFLRTEEERDAAARDLSIRTMNEVDARHEACSRWAYAVPCDEALAVLAQLGPLVEIGAGTGYWAGLLRARGVDVVAYDAEPGTSVYHNAGFGVAECLWSPIEVGDADASLRHPDRTLFLCWPPYNTPMAAEALKAHYRAGGTAIAYIGESDGGCTADAVFHRLLNRFYDQVETVPIPQWWGIHDSLTIWRRR